MSQSSPYLASSDGMLTSLESGSFTGSLWFNPASPGTAGFVPLTIVGAPAWALLLNSNGTVTFRIFNSSLNITTDATSTAVVDDSAWNFIAFRYDLTASLLTIFIGTSELSVPFTNRADATASALFPDFQIGENNLMDTATATADFGVDSVTLWSRSVADSDLLQMYADGLGNDYPFFGGAFNLVFQGSLINNPAAPLVLGSNTSLWNVTENFDPNQPVTSQFSAQMDLLFSGNAATPGYSWIADNFDNKIIFAQHDNRVQYWIPPLPAVALDLPGLPSTDSNWDGVVVFQNHVMLWLNDRLKWSDLEDFSLYIPVAETAVSAVLTLAKPFAQPPPGGQVTVTINPTVAPVGSISLQGDLNFPDTQVGKTSTALLSILNTGTATINISSVTVPTGFTAVIQGQTGNSPVPIAVGDAVAVIITFKPTQAISYSGTVTVTSDATQGTSTFPIAGNGVGVTKIISLSGVLTFGNAKVGKTLSSALVITNKGNSALNVSSVSFPVGYSGSFKGVVPAGGQVVVPFSFTPSNNILYSGQISVVSDSTSGVANISVTGHGYFNVPAPPNIFATDNGSCQFGTVAVGSVSTGTIRVYNTPAGAGIVTITGVTAPTGFSCSFSGKIAAFGFVDIPVTFSPTSPGSYGGFLTLAVQGNSQGLKTVPVSGAASNNSASVALSGNLAFGDVPIGTTVQGLLNIQNTGSVDIHVQSIQLPGGFTSTFTGTVPAGTAKAVVVTFAPTAVQTYSGNVTVTFVSSDNISPQTFPASGNGISLPTASVLVAGQVVSLEDDRGGISYFNYYMVVSMTNTSVVLQLMDLTGATPTGDIMPADGRQFFTVDANEAGETRIVGSKQNGPILRVIPQGDYAYSFKARSIQSIQYVGIDSGTFFIHNEVSGEGLISRESVVDRQDGTMVFLGHKELYAYQGGPVPVPVCQQATQQLYKELDRTRLNSIRLFHNESRKEVWVKYPVVGGFRVLIWNYQEDSATLDDYDASIEFTALGLVDWAGQNSTVGSHVPLIAGQDGNIRIHGLVYSRDGQGYNTVSQSMDFDFGNPDIWKYLDVVVLGLDVQNAVAGAKMSVRVGFRPSLNTPVSGIVWTQPQQVLVDGTAPVPLKVNPGSGSGRYARVEFSSTDPNVQWRVSSFEIHCRPGSFY